ncbi:alpha/beta hydrolase-fold protein [Pontibacter fetidus]|uniref:Histidine kinase n=1 Tax=Pontibacter fetidus TaxID=2700082 RepID=A0A6B2GZP6_9BACT|nr:alpha/beta hydrolase-fold protein [Pontibacter fetidus]NDK55328.1 histidine kinase [Pontibacter fetidus]
MKKLSLVLGFILLATIVAVAQQALLKTVTFKLYAPSLADSSTVYIAGSEPQIGNWNPGKVKLQSKGNHTWQIQVQFPAQTHLEYKYTLGSWDREGTDAKGFPLQNFSTTITQDTTIANTIEHWLDKKTRPFKGGITGMVKYHKGLKATGLQDRDIIVWLPEGYQQSKGKKYPVLYMHDGQNIVDPATSSFGVDWHLDETADSLIKAKAIKPIVIVGIYNTSDRSDEYTPGPKGTAYMDFVVNTVKPFIDKTYRTKKGRKHTAIGGSSAGGIMAFMLAWEYPEVFSKAICMSPAFKIQHIDYVDDVMNYSGKKKKVFLYIDNGGIELEERLQPGIDDMLQALKAKGYKENKDFVWVKAPQDKHSEAAWARRMPLALKLIFGNGKVTK